tara:strand:+ start:350 stop:514 length:165 start_codon:yes stop_codon:yes gene_type:complete
MMGIRVIRFCELCLKETKEDIYTLRQDIKGSTSVKSITIMTEYVCESCKKKYGK